MPHRRSAAETRQAITEAALDLFVARGYGATTLEDIADQLQITRQAVLYHFGSKEELFSSAVQPGFDQLDSAIADLHVSDPPTHDELGRALERLVDVLVEHRRSIAILNRFTVESSVTGMASALVQLNTRLARTLGGSGVDSDPLLRVRVVGALAALGGVMGARLRVPLEDPAERRALAHACLAMLESG